MGDKAPSSRKREKQAWLRLTIYVVATVGRFIADLLG